MIIELDDAQKKLLLETLAIAHQVEFLKGNDNSALEIIIERMCESLRDEGKQEIFWSVFQELDP